MAYLLAASLVWACSFGLIKSYLGGVDAGMVAWIRLSLSFVLFLPFLRLRRIPARLLTRLMLIGAVQYGIMYLTYIASYRFLAGHEVAMFTVLTPLYVTAIHDADCRLFHRRNLLAALLAVAGAAFILTRGAGWEVRLRGVLILQISNLAFAFGQIRYRSVMKKERYAGVGDREVFALMYLGGVLLVSLPCALRCGWGGLDLDAGQKIVLLYLGLVPSGIGFFLWNVGARRAGPGTLAVFNNVKIPLAVVCTLVIFGERVTDPVRLLVGGAVMVAAVIVAEQTPPRRLRLPRGGK